MLLSQATERGFFYVCITGYDMLNAFVRLDDLDFAPCDLIPAPPFYRARGF